HLLFFNEYKMGCCYIKSNVDSILPLITTIESELIEYVITIKPISQRDYVRRIPTHYFLTAYALYKRA
ncbi:unnamed protein product, partial [Rotaria sp. Silwood1]